VFAADILISYKYGLEQLPDIRSNLWIVDAVERCRVIGIDIGFGIGIDLE